MTKAKGLSRREREVMDIVHSLENATAAQIQERMTKAPTNAAVRSILRILVERKQLKFEQDGPRYIYSASAPATAVRQSALKHMLTTFFGGSVEGTIAALLEMEEGKLTENERARVKKMIEQVEKEGR